MPDAKPATTDQTSRALPARAVKLAYEQVADQLREFIVSGELRAGDRLPTEPELCTQFRTSRSTIREALRLLASQGLITTRRGRGGGTNVARPTADHVTDFLGTTLTLLTGAGELSAEELFEARRMLEVPAAGLAAAGKGPGRVVELRSHIPTRVGDLARHELFEMNRAFHEAVILASGNRALYLMTQPIFAILHQQCLGDRATPKFLRAVVSDHKRIVDAIESGDGATAEAAMADHLCNLAPTYRPNDRLESP